MHPPLKYPGAKWLLAHWIVSFFPAHNFYLEPFFGSGAVFFNKCPSLHETINDIDDQVINFFRVCRDYPDELARAINLTPFARAEYESVQENKAGDEIKLTGDCIENARRFSVRCSQSFGSKLADRCGWKNSKHSAGPVNTSVWNRIPDTVFEVSKRLKNAQIENTDAVALIRKCNANDCLIYADPPYLGSTRNSRIYRNEMMGETEHIALLDALLDHTGAVVISGYDNQLYNETLSGWKKATAAGRANSGAERTEVIWTNFEMPKQLNMF